MLMMLALPLAKVRAVIGVELLRVLWGATAGRSERKMERISS